MTDTTTSRVARIISGTVSALVDAVEGAAPEMVMEEAIQEIDGAIDDVRAELGKVIASKHLANTRLMEANRRHEEFDDKIGLAMEQGRDDLAEAAIAQQIDIEAQIPILEHAITEASDQEREFEGYIVALQAKKREMKEELHQYRQSREAAVGRETPSGAVAGAPARTVEKAVRSAESAFDRMMEKAAGMPPGPGMADRRSAAQLAELDDLARSNRIKERLAAIKARRKEEEA